MVLSIFHNCFQKIFSGQLKDGRPKTVEMAIDKLVQKKQKIKFIQVGASDCGLNDPLRDYVLNDRAKGLIIEPIQSSLCKAQERYCGITGLYFANCAIDNAKGLRTIFKIKDVEGLPNWAYQVCSFSREVVLRHEKEIPQIRELMVEESVCTETITELMNQSNLHSPDLLLVDTEGFDAEILKMFPFKNHCPPLVIFEHKHLNEKQENDSLKLLKKYSYQVWKDITDTICWKE
jgi:FkbM family methyltransferase